jgi:hypothetical protein
MATATWRRMNDPSFEARKPSCIGDFGRQCADARQQEASFATWRKTTNALKGCYRRSVKAGLWHMAAYKKIVEVAQQLVAFRSGSERLALNQFQPGVVLVSNRRNRTECRFAFNRSKARSARGRVVAPRAILNFRLRLA